MTHILATNITSPLGYTTTENYLAVKSGASMLHRYVSPLPFPFCASLFSDQQWHALQQTGCNRFESIVLHSINEALQHTDINITASRTVLIISTTKGCDAPTAQRIATKIGVTTHPIIVCNACISGVSAQILAMRMLDADIYDNAIVVGADIQTPFIISGFEALKALADTPCRPFDEERNGLNLGEGAATIVFGKGAMSGAWTLAEGCVRNDAYHISGPHPQGEGCMRALRYVTRDIDDDTIATISVHGTATMYNDQMESKAVERAGLSNIPLSALKGYYGHTMGAAGLIETIITACAVDEGIILPSRGYHNIGVSGKVIISDNTLSTTKKSFVKALSGFGGCNGTLLYSKTPSYIKPSPLEKVARGLSHVTITPDRVTLNGTVLTTTSRGRDMLTELYKQYIGNYPRFYKMDTMSRLAFVASQLLLGDVSDTEVVSSHTAVILFNNSSSVISDKAFQDTIQPDNFFPSPALFVYTLPNITTGEIALHNTMHGETSFYILQNKDEKLMNDIIKASSLDSDMQQTIAGWIDCPEDNDFQCDIKLLIS